MADVSTLADPEVVANLCAGISEAGNTVRSMKEAEAPAEQLDAIVNLLMQLKIQLTDLVGVGGHEYALNKSAYKKEKKAIGEPQ